ncbi:MAG: hypothetical protein AB7I27_03750 [Bacteriovoracaceae bacterium]
MESIKVNADYESVLYHGKNSEEMNRSLEFLAFFLEEKPILSHKSYRPEYLNYVEKITGRRPQIVSSGKYDNWWGDLKDLVKERWMNSKVTTAELNLKQGWCKVFIVNSPDELIAIPQKKFLAKIAYGISGQKFSLLERPEELTPQLKDTPYILEPLLDRKFDFSHYVFPDGKSICYENVVDQNFQYKGSIFQNYHQAEIQNLSFYSNVSLDEWNHFKNALTEIKSYFLKDNQMGFSIDSFVYFDNGLKIRFLSEINYRKTMGLIAYELSRKYALKSPWTMLMIYKSQKSKGGFSFLQEKLGHLENLIILSPGDTRFELLFFFAENAEIGMKLKAKIESLLSS